MTIRMAHIKFASFCLLVILTCAVLPATAQETWEKEGEGEIKDLQIELTKERTLILPRANRYFEKVPPRPFEPIVPAIAYQVKNLSNPAPNFVPIIRPLRIKQEELTKLYGNYLSGGIGNYASFMVDGSVSTKRDKVKMLGADFYWRGFGRGPVDGDQSAQSNTRINLFGQTVTEAALVGANVTYLNQRGYFYGYAPGSDIDREALKQVYQTLSAKLSIENRKKGNVNYRLQGGFSRIADAYVTSEAEWTAGLAGDYLLKNKARIELVADLSFIQRKDSAFDQSRNLVRLQPAYVFSPADRLDLTIGVNLAITNDAFVDGSGGFKAYPHVKGVYRASDNFSAYAMLTGDLDKVNVHTLTTQNFWLDANQVMIHTERSAQLEGGIQAAVGSRFNTRMGVSFASLRSPYFYVTARDPFDPGGVSVGLPVDKFELVYDKSMTQVNPYAEATYYHAEAFSTTLRMDYFSYKTEVQAEAWHRPTYRADLRMQYNLVNKLFLQGGFIVQGGMKAQDPANIGQVVTLATAADLQFKVRYFFSKQLSAFVQLDNLLANQYPIYLNYPARGFQGLVGASWSF